MKSLRIHAWICALAAMVTVTSEAGLIFEDDFQSDTLGSAPANWTLGNSPTTFTVESDAQSPIGDAGGDRGMRLDNDPGVTFERMERSFTAHTGTFYLQFDYYGDGGLGQLHNLQIGDGDVTAANRGVNLTMSTYTGVVVDKWYRFTLTIDVVADTYDVRVQSLEDSSLDSTTTGIAFHNAQAELDILRFWFNTGSAGGLGDFDLDNILVTDDPISWSGVGVSNISTSTATAYVTLAGMDAEVTLYWKQGSSAPEQHTGWDGTNSTPSGLVSTGLVERAMTGLQADTRYAFIFYGTNSASTAWSAAGSVTTALSSAQAPVFTSAVVGQGSVTLGWTDNASNETAYMLMRSTNAASDYAVIGSLAADTVTYEDSGLAIDTYYYRLAATNAGNGSATAFTACETNATVTEAAPSLLFYEGFDYTDGAVMNDANQIGGWNANKDKDNGDPWSNTGDPMMVHDGDAGNGESWDGVFTSGASGLTVVQSGAYVGANPEVFDSDTSASQGASDHLFAFKALDPSVTSTFTDGSTTWFSFISYKQGGRHAIAAIGAGHLTGDRSRTSAAGEPAIGMGGRYNSGDARAHTWAGGAGYANGATSAGNATEMFLIAKIEWAAAGLNDTITMAAFADGATITEAAFNAATKSVLTADFDQSTFDTLSIGNQKYYIDEIRIATTFEAAVSGLPSASVAPPGAITWSDAGVTNITANTATAYSTLGGTNAEVTLFWKKGSSAPQQFTGWDGTNSTSGATLIGTGSVQRAMTGLDADTLYSCIFYGTNSAAISNAWSEAVQFSTALTAAQTPVFTSAVAGPGSITLGWTDNASNETGYILQRAAGAGPYSVISAAVAPDTVTYLDGGLAPGAYSYRLAATNAGNGSATASTACETNATVTEAVPGLLFYEGFDYGAGPLNGTNGWSASDLNIVSSTDQGAGWNNTDSVGIYQTGLFAGTNNAEGYIALDPSVTATFADGTTTWLSWIAINVDSRYAVVAIGTGTFGNRAETASGQNIGGGSKFNSGAANPSYWDPAVSSGDHQLGPNAATPAGSPTFLIAKIEWGAGGADDTVTLAAFATSDTITEAAFDAKVVSGDATSLAADLDQSTFSNLNVATSRHTYFDEIRIATTFEAAAPAPPRTLFLFR